ncbi:restriction endonuclease [Cytophaga hutchinsonii]|uniref:Possible endonuclease n=1 Tax=Cytophaga hutchinsonii (strain ATCC 33406 / DSM 1761 / CIP 103989 / NBRC 15051 / NCIMB 9469 / D465) TaxID=269798 RepID=A0A6N4SM61_CYTH3|nr:restriction endonuclease [Cytophaga hutchinsonii]ABG57336.1 possible endonuclease [Cytophaga hutchinsonii ATCC 33406]SFX46651.1 restriction system protein [Cytophaga hutchinsonii ATCC 33406]
MDRKKKHGSFILTNEFTLEEFLAVALLPNSEKEYYPVSHFPTDKHLEDYLATIESRSEKEVRDLLRHFLPKNSTYGKDNYYRKYYIQREESESITLEQQVETNNYRIEDTEYYRRLIFSIFPHEHVWEGLTWTLDLLPHSPNEAIRVIDAYFLANCQFLPDDLMTGISDCTTILRARYFDKEHPREIFLNLLPKEFEQLVAGLYSEMKYLTRLTKTTRDGGVDIFASKDEPGKKEKLVIQCKRYTPKITLDEVKVLHSTTLSTKSTKGVFVTSSEYTRDAKKFSEDNPSVELIDYKQLIKLLNKHYGPYWTSKISRILNNQKIRIK